MIGMGYLENIVVAFSFRTIVHALSTLLTYLSKLAHEITGIPHMSSVRKATSLYVNLSASHIEGSAQLGSHNNEPWM